MNLAFYTVAAIAGFGALYHLIRFTARTYLKFRGPSVITCPETEKPAGVTVDAAHAAITATLGKPPELRLKECSRWPERENCGQECLQQIAAAPEDCMVRNILTKWYLSRNCTLCGKSLGNIDWLEHKPALLDPEGKTLECSQVGPEKLPDVLSTHKPICWNCHVAETFRREHADLVVDRSWKGSPSTPIR